MRKSVQIGLCLSVLWLLTGILRGSDAVYPPMRLTAAESREARGLASYAKASQLVQTGSRDLAEICRHLSEALVALPESERVLEALVFLRTKNEDWSSLLGDLTAPLAANPESVSLNLCYIECLLKLQRKDEAETRLQIMLHHRSGVQAEAVILACSLHWDNQQYEPARQMLRTYLRRKNLKSAYKLRVFALEVYRWEEVADHGDAAKVAVSRKAAQAMAAAVIGDPEVIQDARVSKRLLALLGEAELWVEQLSFLEKLPEAERGRDAWIRMRLRALCKTGDSAAAIRLVQEDDGSPQHEELQHFLGEVLIEERSLTEALSIFEKLHMRNLAEVSYRMQLAWLYGQTGSPKRGLALLEPVKFLPFGGLRLQALLWRLAGNPDKAWETFQAAAEIGAKQDPEMLDAEFYVSQGFAAEQAGHADEAVAAFRKAWQRDPDDPNLANAFGYTLADRNQELELAEKLILQAVAAESDNVAFLDSLAWIHYRQQRHRQALQAMTEVLRGQPAGEKLDSTILVHLAEILQANGYAELAKTWRPQQNDKAEASR